MEFEDYEVPVARSMVTMADDPVIAQGHPLAVFNLYWPAFNNVYVTVAERSGKGPQVRLNGDGSVRTRALGSVTVPTVIPVSERDQLGLAFDQFSDTLKHFLASHDSTRFFAYRTPSWGGFLRATDVNGQRLNGVINVGHTVDARHLIWSPIDAKGFEDYVADSSKVALRDSVARQVLDLLYTVRNNTFHGGKRADDANDREVLDHAVPLLSAIVKAFLKAPKAKPPSGGTDAIGEES